MESRRRGERAEKDEQICRQAVTWLRTQLGDAELRRWLEQHRGGKLSPRQLCFWQIVLDLPERRVKRWIQAGASRVWEQRLNP